MANENEVFKFDKAEPNPIFSKYSERREQWQTENKVFKFDMAELNHSCYKYNKEAESRKRNPDMKYL